MKKTLLFSALTISTILFSQSQETKSEISVSKKKYPEYVLMTDVVKSEKGFYSIDKTVKMKNGKSQEVDVKFSVGFSDYEPTESDLGKININTEQTLWLAKFNLKNKFSFEPFETSVFKKGNSWVIYLKYTAKNDLGIEKEGMKVYKYDLSGKEIK